MKSFVEMVLAAPNCQVPENIRQVLLTTLRLDNWEEGLRDYFADHADVALQFRSSCRAYAFAFVESEISRLKIAKKDGTLSEEDMIYAKADLQHVLDAIEEMCRGGIRRAKGEE